MKPHTFLAVAVVAFVSTAALAEPAELMNARRALASAAGSHDIAGAANLMHFPLRVGAHSLGEAQFVRDPLQFKRIFQDGDASDCLGSKPAEQQASPDVSGSPWVVECSGRQYYFGQFGGGFLMGGYAGDD